MLSSSIRLFRAHFLEVNREEILDKALEGLEKQLREEELSGTDVLPLLDQMKEVRGLFRVKGRMDCIRICLLF